MSLLAHPTAPTPKSHRGCWIAAAIVAGVLCVTGIGAAVAVYAMATSKRGKTIIGAFTEGADEVQRAQSAAGTPELRAAGCENALVLHMEKFMEIASALDEDAGPPMKPHVELMIACTVEGSRAPTCDALAKVYVDAVGVSGPAFMVQISPAHGSTICMETYAGSGVRRTSLARPPRAGAAASASAP